jgi:predicted DsbA family dithiol-disulfide isomerase
MRIEIWSDIVCPWCYLGKRRFENALAQFEHRSNVEVIWRSFELDPAAPRGYRETQTELLAAKYGVPVEQAKAMNARLAQEAGKDGLQLRFDIAKPGNTFDAHRLIHLGASMGNRHAVVERFFRGYFCEGSPIGDPETLKRLATEAGLPADAVHAVLTTDAFADEVRADEGEARRLGISGVPFFAIDDRYGVSGAQTPEVLLATLWRAYEEPSGLIVVQADGADTCREDGCRGDGCTTGALNPPASASPPASAPW